MGLKMYSFLFPGQGAQKPGMGKAFYDAYGSAREVFNRAEKVLTDCSIKSLCFEADEEELRKTENTQPTLFTASYAIYSVLSERGLHGDVFAGHSLGEYTAVAASGYLSFEDGLRIVRKRGLLMRDCDPEQRGGMAAIIGIDGETVEEVCRETGDVFPANFNSPNQIVISGKKEKVKIAMETLGSMGAKRVIMLNVGGPFHSPYMKEAAEELEKGLNAVEWRKGSVKIISNVSAEISDNPETIRGNLVKQLFNPVLWSLSISKLIDMGYKRYIESGPGGILRGLFRSISKEAEVFSVEKPEDINNLD